MADKGPATGLGILLDEKRVNDLILQKTGAKAVLKSACNLALFVCFVTLFTVLACSEPLGNQRTFEAYVRRRFDTAAAVPLSKVESATTFWQYIDRSFMPGLYGNGTAKYFYPGATVDKFLEIDGANRLFGVARLRMLKIQRNSECLVQKALKSAFPACYGAYMVGTEDNAAYGPPDSRTGANIFQYRKEPSGTQVTGKVATYGTGGFMQAFTSRYNETLTAVRMMERYSFFGPGTRAVFLDFTVYNFNLGCYAVCQILFEVTPDGDWLNTFNVEVLIQRHLSPIASRSTGDWLALLGEIILILFVLRYLLEEASEFVGFRGWRPYIKFEYFEDAWNLLDWLNLILILVTLGYKVSTWGLASSVQVYVGDPAKQGLNTFTDLSGVAANVRNIHRLLAFNTVLTWFKAVKYISILPYITTFMETVSMSQRSLISFLSVFWSFLFGFTLAYHFAFGERVATFATPWRSLVFLFRTFLGNGDMTVVYNSAPLTGSLLIILYVLAMFFVILNLFYSLMINGLADVRQAEEAKQGRKWEQWLDKLNEFWNTVMTQGRLEHRFRTCFPGLYVRWMARRRKQREAEREADDEALRQERARRPEDALALGPGNPALGRRARRALNTVSAEDIEESDDGSEVDLGPLHAKEQITGTLFSEAFAPNGPGLPMLQDGSPSAAEPTEEGITLVIQATRYVVDGIVDRTNGARSVLFGEIAESKEVLLKVGSVLEVLGRRARDLEAQQRQLLRHF